MRKQMDQLSDDMLRRIVIATGYDPTFLRVNKRTYGLECGIGAHWLRMLISACDTEPSVASDKKPGVRLATSTHRAKNRAFPVTEYYLQFLPLYARRLNVHRIVELVARGSLDDAGALHQAVRAAAVRACEDQRDPLHGAMLVRAASLMDVVYIRTIRATDDSDPDSRCRMVARGNLDWQQPSRKKNAPPPLTWKQVRATAMLMLEKLKPAILAAIRTESIDGKPAFANEAQVESARCNIGLQACMYGDALGIHALDAHTLRFMVLMYMDPETRPEIVRKWGPLSFFATSSVQTISGLFHAATYVGGITRYGPSATCDTLCAVANLRRFSGDLFWDTGQVRRMVSAFAESAFNGRIDHWNVSRVETMAKLFEGNVVFNRPLAAWNTRRVASFNATFRGARKFDHSLRAWDVGNAKDTRHMFTGTDAPKPPLSK
jgi:hypothetical protein